MASPFPSISGLSIERLKTFCLIIEAGSIASAARGDPVKQSQFSRQVRELEIAIGTKLFRRVGRTLRVTESGRQLALLTQSYFHAVEDLRGAVARESETIRIAAGESVFRWLVLPRLPEIQAGIGSMQLDFHTTRTVDAIQGLRDGSIDLAIVRSNVVEKDLTAEPCGRMEYQLVVPRSMLSARSAAGFDHLEKIPMAILGGGGEFAVGVLDLAAKNGKNIEVRLQTASFSLLLAALCYTDLAAVIPAPAVAGLSNERFAVVDFPGISSLSRELSLVHNPKAAQLRESIRRTAGRIGKVLGA